MLIRLPLALASTVILLLLASAPITGALPALRTAWNVDDLRPGMKGHGVSVFVGAKQERFEVEILGVLKNTSPGRDMVLARLSGCNLEKTGVIAGMSGSPIYVDGRLVGALAFGWAFGTEPIAGITPIRQMIDFAAQAQAAPAPEVLATVQLPRPLGIAGVPLAALAVSMDPNAEGVHLRPLQTPLVAAGFSSRVLRQLGDSLGHTGLAPMQIGSAAGHLKAGANPAPPRPGDPLAVALVTGDFDISGIGTLTHVEGKQVYGWGHPFMSLGACALPLYTAHIHAVYPRQTVSFKMGSPLRPVGTLLADTSTGIAGLLGEAPPMLPVEARVQRFSGGEPRTFQCQVARHRQLLPQLVFAVLSNSVDMEGDLPEDLSAELKLRIDLEGEPPLVLQDVFSGTSFSGSRAPLALYIQVSALLSQLQNHSFAPIVVKKVSASTVFQPRRLTAEIDQARLEKDIVRPGETLRLHVRLRPYQGPEEWVHLALPLPDDLPDGEYPLVVSDDYTCWRALQRDDPALSQPRSRDQLLRQARAGLEVGRTRVVARLVAAGGPLTIQDQTHSNLPASVVGQLTEAGKGTPPAQAVPRSVVAKEACRWVVQGSHKLKVTVKREPTIR